MLLNAWLKCRFDLLHTYVDSFVDDLSFEMLPFVVLGWEGEPDLEVSQLLIKFYLLY